MDVSVYTQENIRVTVTPESGASVEVQQSAPALVVTMNFGPQGPVGPQGPQGPPGPINTLSIGSVTTNAPGTPASASLSGSSPAQVLNLGIPRGADGFAEGVVVYGGTY